MIYCKSILAGLAAVFVSAMPAESGLLAWEYWSTYRLTQQTDGIGAFVVDSPWASIWWFFAAAPPVFAAGFYWQFRRASKR